MYATKFNRLDILKLLVNKVDINILDKYWWNALMFDTQYNNKDIIQLLLNNINLDTIELNYKRNAFLMVI